MVARLLAVVLGTLTLLAPVQGRAQDAEAPRLEPAPGAMTRRRLAAWVTSGVAAAALIAAGTCTGYAIHRAEDLNAVFDRRYSSGQPVRYSEVAPEIRSRQRQLERLNYAIFAMHLTWVLAAGVSIYLWVTSRARREPRAPRRAWLALEPAPWPGGAALPSGPGD